MQCQRKVKDVLDYLVKQEPKALADLLTRLPKMGVGRQFTRSSWDIQDKSHLIRPVYWTITKVTPNREMTNFRIWGMFCPRNNPYLKERTVRSPEKKQWLLLPKDFNNKKLRVEQTKIQSTSNPAASKPVAKTASECPSNCILPDSEPRAETAELLSTSSMSNSETPTAADT